MILPTIISQIILVIYNLADTWYVGLTENPDAVAAISLCLPVYTILSAFSNLFGLGGAAALSRALGSQDHARAQRLLRTALAGSVVGAAFYSLFMAVWKRQLLLLIGADTGTLPYAADYVFWTIVVGGIPTILSPVCGHLIRAMGEPKLASAGMILGAILNILLDPLFMFILLPPGNEVTGAAIATALSNTVGLIFFAVHLFRHAKRISPARKSTTVGTARQLTAEILRDGLPGFCMVALAMVSNCFLNSMISSLGSEAVAGLGIVRKIDQLAYAVNQGITQGMLPLVAYCYAAGRKRRMWAAIGISAAASEGISLVCMAVSLLFPTRLVSIFIREPVTIGYGVEFLRILCLAIPVYTLTFVMIAVFQAVGKGMEPFLLSILHKGTLDIALYFLIRRLAGVERILWAAPISESVALIVGMVMLVFFFRNQSREQFV